MPDIEITNLTSLSLTTPTMGETVEIPPQAAILENSAPRAASFRKMQHLLAAAPQLKPMGKYVGPIHKEWRFPSPHLPIGMSIDNHHFASWNVLDSRFIRSMAENDPQGLSQSWIGVEHFYIDDTGLTIRELRTVVLILQMLHHPTHPKHILALQECSSSFLEELKGYLPSRFAIIEDRGNVIVVNRNFFEVIEAKETATTFQNVILRKQETGEIYRIVNAYVPEHGRADLAEYLANTFNPYITTVVMGDMHFNEVEMESALRTAFSGSISPFSVYAPYCTYVSPALISQAVDLFLVPKGKGVVLHTPEQVASGLEPLVNLLN